MRVVFAKSNGFPTKRPWVLNVAASPKTAFAPLPDPPIFCIAAQSAAIACARPGHGIIAPRASFQRLPIVLLALSFSLLATPAPSRAAEIARNEEVVEKKSDLKAIRDEIEALRQELSTTEEARRDAFSDLRESERSLSAAQRELHTLNGRRTAIQSALDELSAQSQALQQRLRTQQAQLEKILHRQYLRGKPDPLRLFLNGEDANQLARDLYYLEAIGRSRGRLLQSIENTLQHQQKLTEETREKAQQLASLETAQREKSARLELQRQQRQATLLKISGQLASQRQAIGDLQRDEKRLGQLIDRLSKIIAVQAAEARVAARRQEQQRLNEQRDAAHREAQARLAASPPARQEIRQETKAAAEKPPAGDQTSAATLPSSAAIPPDKPASIHPSAPSSDVGGLARLKGQLHAPVRGTLANRFGAVRQEGSLWRGLFIRAGSGAEVRSIAGGRVVFAEWMRGFGNLLIVDHGDSYLSVYANNEALLKQVGENVRAGEAVATVGNSGGNPESGLYFELRHQGKPLNPSAWLPLK